VSGFYEVSSEKVRFRRLRDVSGLLKVNAESMVWCFMIRVAQKWHNVIIAPNRIIILWGSLYEDIGHGYFKFATKVVAFYHCVSYYNNNYERK
jgi:hypothetical protein